MESIMSISQMISSQLPYARELCIKQSGASYLLSMVSVWLFGSLWTVTKNFQFPKFHQSSKIPKPKCLSGHSEQLPIYRAIHKAAGLMVHGHSTGLPGIIPKMSKEAAIQNTPPDPVLYGSRLYDGLVNSTVNGST